MTGYKCVNDIFAYCSDHPESLPEPSNPNSDYRSTPTGGRCRKNPLKCPSFQTNTQKNALNPHKSKSKPPQVENKGTKRKK